MSFLRLISRDLTDPQPFMLDEMAREFDPLVTRYTHALTQALPGMPLPELFWRMQFTIGAMLYAAAHQHDFERISHGLCQRRRSRWMHPPPDRFLCGWLQAPLTTAEAQPMASFLQQTAVLQSQ